MNILLALITSLTFSGVGAVFIWQREKVWKFFKMNTDMLGMENKSNYSESPVYGKGKKAELGWIRRFGIYLFTIGSLAFVLIVLVGYSQSEMHFPLYPYIDTIFVKDFSWKKFEQVKVEMSEDEVTNILGEPLLKTDNCWRYSTDGKLWPYADFSYYLVQVCFKGGVVDSKLEYEFGN